jgi:hypothetical protein
MLELRAVYLQHGTGISKQNLGGGLDETCFSRARGAEKKKAAERPARGVQARAQDLI